jgi:hypothetical protein
VADLDGDAVPDLVTASFVSGDVSVLRGNGDGSFQAPVAFAASNNASSVAVADLDGDTVPDLVTGNGVSNDVSVLRGNGDGSFQAPVSFAMGDGPADIAAADLNGDDVPDVVTANISSHDVTVLLSLFCATPADRDGDGVPDDVDNCPRTPNGPGGGTCTAGHPHLIAEFCKIDSDCGSQGFCSLDQEDYNADGIGDACDPNIVPEPSQWVMLIAGTAFLGLLYRRRVRGLRLG